MATRTKLQKHAGKQTPMPSPQESSPKRQLTSGLEEKALQRRHSGPDDTREDRQDTREDRQLWVLWAAGWAAAVAMIAAGSALVLSRKVL